MARRDRALRIPESWREGDVQARCLRGAHPSLGISEAEIIRLIYRLAAVDKKSCYRISDHLNSLNVPCAYTRDNRSLLRGKRRENTSGLWRPGRVRNLIVSTTYMGQHQYGKRSPDKRRQIVTRPVPAIVTEQVWQKAQQTLEDNFLFSARSAINQYLLRAKVKCSLCGLTYIGSVSKRTNGKVEFYYICNGKHAARGLYGAQGKRCPSKSINGSYLEQLVWQEVESFLRNPGAVLAELQKRMTAREESQTDGQERLEHLELALQNKTEERGRVLAIYRRGRIDDKTLDQQLGEIEAETAAIQKGIEEAKHAASQHADDSKGLASAEQLLCELRAKLDEPISWKVKRRLVELLVGEIRVATVERDGKKSAEITATYRFAPVATCTDIRASNNCYIWRTYRTIAMRAA